MRAAVVAACVAALTFGLASPAAAQSALPPPGKCQTVSVPVSLTEGGPRTSKLAGTFCAPANGAVRKADLYVAGGSYDRSYWSWPVDTARYSWLSRTQAAGRYALSVDPVGVGESTRPPGLTVTLDVQARALHQAVEWLRALGFTDVTQIGHSLGSVQTVAQVGRFNDVERVVLTGLVHHAGARAAEAATAFGPALGDARVQPPAGVDYLTTLPGRRISIFHSPSTAANVTAYDEANPDVFSAPQLPELPKLFTGPIGQASQNVRRPVLVLVGGEDALFCGLGLSCTDAALTAYERPYYTGSPSFTARALPTAGHSLTIHPRSAAGFDIVNAWINTH